MFGSDAALKLAVTKEISMANPQPKAGRLAAGREEKANGAATGRPATCDAPRDVGSVSDVLPPRLRHTPEVYRTERRPVPQVLNAAIR